MTLFIGTFLSEAGVKNPNPRKRKKQSLKMGHGGTLDSSASGVLGNLKQARSFRRWCTCACCQVCGAGLMEELRHL